MKRITTILVGLFLSMITITTVWSADTLDDFLEGIDTNRGYTTGMKLSLQEKGNDYVIIQSPVIKKDNVAITNYTLTYSEKSIDQLDESTKDTGFVFTGTDLTGTMISFKLGGLDPTKTYYIVIVPRDTNNQTGEPSEQISVSLGSSLANTNSSARGPEQHSAAADMSLANISHTTSGNLITLTWTPQSSAPTVELFLRHVNDSTFRTLGRVAMADGSYQFQTTREGTHFVRFIPLNSAGQPDGKEFIYTVRVAAFAAAGDDPTTPGSPTMGKVRVGPTTNIAIILIGGLIIYSMYRLRKMRHQ